MSDTVTATRLRGAAIRKFFDLGEPDGNPAPAGGQLGERTDATLQQGAKSFQDRPIRIGLSKASRFDPGLNKTGIVAALDQVRPDARVIFPGECSFEHMGEVNGA